MNGPHRRRRGQAVAALLTIGAFLGGSGLSAPGQVFAHVATAPNAAEPTSGGTFTFPLWYEVARGWDPAVLNGATDAAQVRAVYDMLLLVDRDSGEIKPNIAESLESDDSLVWTLTLTEGVLFSDGTPYDAEAVKYNWERLADPEMQAIQASAAGTIASMEVTDPLTLEITLVEPNGQFPTMVATRLYWIASPTALADTTPGSPWNSPVGAGPYLLDSWVQDSSATLVRNPDYWQDGLPYIDEVVFPQITDDAQRLNAVIAGDANGANLGPYGYNLVQQAESAGLNAEITPVLVGGPTFQFNVTAAPFDDPVARQAVWHALDLAGLNETVFLGLNELVYPNIIPEGSPLYTALDLPEQYDPELAQELFDQYAADHGAPLEFSLMTGPQGAPMANYMLANLAEYENVTMTIENIATADNTPRQLAHEFQMAQFGALGVDPEPDFFDVFHTDQSRNGSGYSNPAYDEAVEIGRNSLDVDERREAYATAITELVADVPAFWFVRQVDLHAYDDSVRGITYGAGYFAGPLLTTLYLDEG